MNAWDPWTVRTVATAEPQPVFDGDEKIRWLRAQQLYQPPRKSRWAHLVRFAAAVAFVIASGLLVALVKSPDAPSCAAPLVTGFGGH